MDTDTKMDKISWNFEVSGMSEQCLKFGKNSHDEGNESISNNYIRLRPDYLHGLYNCFIYSHMKTGSIIQVFSREYSQILRPIL